MSASEIPVDVVVVGAGVAAFVAALRARAANRSVMVVGKSGGASAAWSGAVDVADGLVDAVPGPGLSGLERGEPVEDAIARLAGRLPRHPYARLGAARVNVRDAVRFVVDNVPALGLSQRADGRNHVVATQLGTVKRAAAVPRSQLLDLAELPNTAVVGIVEWRDLAGFNARPVSEMLRFAANLGAASRAPRFVDVVVGRVNNGDVFVGNGSFARALDDEAVRLRFVDALHQRLSSMEPQPTHLLMPAAFTSLPTTAMLEATDKKLGRPLRELLALPPSMPGDRLLRALRERAVAAGVVVKDGAVDNPVVVARSVTSLDVSHGPERQKVRPRHVVLATGRFLGGGLVRDNTAREALFGLPVVADGASVGDQFIGNLTDAQVDGSHAIFRAGVVVDDQLRPLAGTNVALDNVTCAGTLIGGFDPTRDGAALGVTLFTAWLAGGLAADAVAAAGSDA